MDENASQLRLFRVFARIFAHKPYQNANPTHSVIWLKGVVILYREGEGLNTGRGGASEFYYKKKWRREKFSCPEWERGGTTSFGVVLKIEHGGLGVKRVALFKEL